MDAITSADIAFMASNPAASAPNPGTPTWIVAMNPAQNRLGSASALSQDSHQVTQGDLAAAQFESSTLLPAPADPATTVSRWPAPAVSRSISAGLVTKVAALNPKLLVVDLLLMGNRRPVAMFVCFMLGGIGLAVAIGLVDVFVLQADAIKARGSPSAGLDLAPGDTAGGGWRCWLLAACTATNGSLTPASGQAAIKNRNLGATGPA
jgi:hypothetical protein